MVLVVLYRESPDDVPFLAWWAELPDAAKALCRSRLFLLEQNGHQLRRPIADYLRDGIHELRAKRGKVQYRLLYFFHGHAVVVISHGIAKKGAAVPPIEIDRALKRKRAFEADPEGHTHEGEA